MAKTILAIVTAFIAVATVFASTAEACISCEHVPVVVRGSQTSHAGTLYATKRFYARTRTKARARARARAIAAAKAKAKAIAAAKAKANAVAGARAKAKAKAIAAAKAAAAKEVELAEATDNENSTISTASSDKITTIDTKETSKEELKISKNLGCKKFFPAVGMTLTVPCE